MNRADDPGPAQHEQPAPPLAQWPLGPPPPPAIDDLPRRSLHPLTPLLESMQFFIAVLAAAGIQIFTSRNFMFAIIAAVVAAVGGGIVSLIAIQYRGFLIHGTDLHIYAGVLTRNHRTVPLDRLQSVDVVRPLQARIFGLAQLRIEIAGSDGSDEKLSYLKHDQALALRAELLAVAGHAPVPGTTAEAAPAPEVTPLVPTVAVRRIAYAYFLRWLPVQVGVLLFAGIAFGVASYFFGAGAVASTAWVAFFAPVLLGYLQSSISMINGFLRHCRFRLDESERRLLVERGLTDRTHETVPLGRITTVSLTEPLMWRLKRWKSVEASTASAAQEGGGLTAAVSTLLPVGPPEQVGLVAAAALPNVPWDRIEVERPPRRVRWRMPLQWKRSGAAMGEHALLVRGGYLVNITMAVPYARIQSVTVTQGPVQRMQRVATVTAQTAGSATRHAVAIHREADEAAAMAAELRLRADAAADAETPRLS